MNNPSLVNCLECGHSISSHAPKCSNPKCNHPEYPHGVLCIYCRQKERFSQAVLKKDTLISREYDDPKYINLNIFSHKDCYQQFYLLKINCSLCLTKQNISVGNKFEISKKTCQQCGNPFKREDLIDGVQCLTCVICRQVILKGLKFHWITEAYKLNYIRTKLTGCCHEVCLDANSPEWRDVVKRAEEEDRQRKFTQDKWQQEQEKKKKELEQNRTLEEQRPLNKKKNEELEAWIFTGSFFTVFFLTIVFFQNLFLALILSIFSCFILTNVLNKQD